MLRGDLTQPCKQNLTNIMRVLLERLIAQDIKDGQTSSDRYVVSTKRGEVLHPVVECIGYRTGGHHSAHGLAVPNRLAHHDDIRDNVVCFKRPEMCTYSSKTNLDFIGNTNTTGCPDIVIDSSQIPIRQDNLPADTGQRLGNISPQAPTFGLDTCDDRLDLIGILAPSQRIFPFKWSAIIIGNECRMDPIWRTGSTRSVMFVWTYVNQSIGVPMIRGIQHYDVRALGICLHHADSELVGFTRRIHKVTDR